MKATRLFAVMYAAVGAGLSQVITSFMGNPYEQKALPRNPTSGYLKKRTGTFKQNKRRGL